MITCPECCEGEIYWNEAEWCYKCSFCGRIFELKDITKNKNV